LSRHARIYAGHPRVFCPITVMPALAAGNQVFTTSQQARKTWMAWASPAMTKGA